MTLIEALTQRCADGMTLMDLKDFIDDFIEVRPELAGETVLAFIATAEDIAVITGEDEIAAGYTLGDILGDLGNFPDDAISSAILEFSEIQ